MEVKMFRTTFFVSITLLISLILPPISFGMSGMHHGDSTKAPAEVKVEFYAEPNEGNAIRAGENFRVGFHITDGETGEAVSNIRPGAWMKLRRAGKGMPDQKSCEQMIRTYKRTGILTVPADVDLSGFSIVTVNDDNSVGIYNPKVNLKTSNLQALIPFKGQPGQWSLDQERGMVYVTLPKEGKVAVIDIRLHKVKQYIEVGELPRQVLFRRDSPYLWVGNDGSGTVSVIERESLTVVHTIAVGSGPVELVLGSDNRFAFAGSDGDGRVAVIDIPTMQEVGRVTLGPGKLSLAYSSQRMALFVAHENLGELTVVDPLGKNATGVVLEPGIHSLTETPDGRFLLALIPERRQVAVIDAATSSVLGHLPTEADPDHIVFSPDYVYVRNLGSPNITVIELSGLESPGTVPVAHIPIGVIPPGAAKGLAGVDTMAAMHHGGHALIVNPADNRVYLYMEGMMAPMNSFKTYTSRPLGILLYDRTLMEGESPGNYETYSSLEKPGIYDVPFFLGSPQKAECFELVVAPNPALEQGASIEPVVSWLFSNQIFPAGEKARLRFKIHDAEKNVALSDIRDIEVMSALKGAHWQHRASARALGDGLYEAEFSFPKEGSYYILVEARSLGIAFGDLRHELAQVTNERKISDKNT